MFCHASRHFLFAANGIGKAYLDSMVLQRTIKTTLCALLLTWGATVATAQNRHVSHSVLRSGEWYRLTIAESGLHAVGCAELPALQGKRIESIALYAQGGSLLPENNSTPRADDLPPLATQVTDRNGNGVFDADDQVLFYAEGPDVWRYDEMSQSFLRQRHAYDNYNYVFLRCDATSAARVLPRDDNPTPNQADITTYTARTCHETDEVNTHHTGLIWVGDRLSGMTPQRTITLRLEDIVPDSEVAVRYGVASVASSASRMTLSLNGKSSSVAFTSTVPYVEQSAQYRADSPTLSFQLSYSCSESSATGYVDYIDACATAPLRFRGGTLAFRSTQGLGSGHSARFVIANAPQQLQVWDVTKIDSIFSLSLSYGNDSATFVAATETVREYIAFDGSNYATPMAVTAIENQDLHGTDNPDMVIVAHPTLRSQAEQLAALHSIHDDLHVLVVTPRQVYNEFSGGKQDPTAIREMMRMFYERSKDGSRAVPRYLLLFGKATFDPRNFTHNDLTTVVTWVTRRSFIDDSPSYTTDDYFGYLDSNESGENYESMELGIGRLPAKNSDEATLLVNKIEHYLLRSDLADASQRGDWRNYITLLADDADPSQRGDTVFVRSSENVAKRIAATYPQYNFDKIYADAYRQQSGAIGSYYPDVNNALRQRLDNGTLLINYIGHGSPQYIGTERYIEFTDISSYSNRERYFFFVSSTCSYGHADRVDDICGAEALVLAPNAAIAAISAGRPIPHVEKSNSDICYYALDPQLSIGDALRKAKNNTSMPHCIMLYGDPALRLTLPRNQVVVTAINEKAVQDGIDDSATVLSRVTIEGEIHDSRGLLQEDFTGTLFPTVFDRAATTQTLANDNAGTEVTFAQQNSILYKGVTTVEGGRFRYSFVVPRDVQYQYAHAKLSHYAKNIAGDDATGQYGNLLLGGLDENADLRVSRPRIRLYLGDSNFIAGGITGQDPLLYAILDDTLGINAAGAGLGHDITAVLDNNGNSTIVLNDFYEPAIDNPQRGYIRYRMEALTPGWHTLTLKAWNIYNYSATATLRFCVRSNDTTVIGPLHCSPNPTTSQAHLALELNRQNNVRSILFRIYDITGRLVVELHPSLQEVGNVAVGRWNLKYSNGSVVPDGIYIAQAIVATTDGNQLTTTTKIVKMKQ